MRRNRTGVGCRAALAGVAAGLAIAAEALSATNCTEPPSNCQLPDQMGHGANGIVGATSDAVAGYEVLDNFVVDAGGSITSICWWGFYLDFDLPADCSEPPPADDFTVTYFTNGPGCPGGVPDTLLAGPFAVTAARAATGNVIPSGVGDLIEFVYTASHPAVGVDPGQCVWVAVQNDTSGTPQPLCVWLWSTAPSAGEGGQGDGHSHQSGAPNPVNDFDLAFCIDQPLGDQTVCGHPLPACIGADGFCAEAHPKPGCDDPCCCTEVCLAIPDCCDVAWDQPCVDVALKLGCIELPCLSPAGCQLLDTATAFNSTPGQLTAVDDFTAAAGGAITELCWYGVYNPGPVLDSFRVRYFTDDMGSRAPSSPSSPRRPVR